MRVLHFADLHIGVENYGRPLPEKGWSSRMQDFLDAYDFLVDYAIDNGVDAVIFAGDAYKSREPTQTHQREFARRIRRLSDANISTFLLVGNHDLPNAEGRAHALEIYDTLNVPNVYVGDNSWFEGAGLRPQVMETRSGPLQVAFLPWPQVSRYTAAFPEAASLPIDQLYALVEKELQQAIALQAEELDENVPALLTCHVSINDWLVTSNKGSEQFMTIGTAPTLLKSGLSAPHFDYVALGHHHNPIEIDLTTPCYYSGSMQAVDFGEEGQAKGFMVFDIEPRKRRGDRIGGSGMPRKVEVPARPFVTVEVAPREMDPTAEVCAAIERAPIDDAIVRVAVNLSYEQSSQFRLMEARKLLERAHFVGGFRVMLPDEVATRLPPGVQPDAASPMESLETYLKLKNIDDGRRARLLSAAEDLMHELGA